MGLFKNRLTKDLIEYLQIDLQKYGCKVFNKPMGEEYPLVVVEQVEDSDMGLVDPTERISYVAFEINIYTQPKIIDGNVLNEIEVSEYIQDIIATKLGNLGMKRLSCRPTPNIDTTLYRVTMRYIVKTNIFRQMFF